MTVEAHQQVPLVIYHGNCQDGFTAAWAIWIKYPDWEFYPGKHGDPPPDVTNRKVYMVDFSYKRPVMLELAKKATAIIVIDHHQTAKDDLVDLPDNVGVLFDMTKSGAMLTWIFFHNAEPAPLLVQYVQDRDLWKFTYPETKDITAFVFSQRYDFYVWNTVNDMITQDKSYAQSLGAAIVDKHDKDIKELSANKFRYVIGGQEVWTCNVPYTMASDMANLLAEGEPFASTYYYDGKGYVFSLRSKEDGADVSEIAKQYGGGGHKHAAGFKLESSFLIFDPKKLGELCQQRLMSIKKQQGSLPITHNGD